MFNKKSLVLIMVFVLAFTFAGCQKDEVAYELEVDDDVLMDDVVDTFDSEEEIMEKSFLNEISEKEARIDFEGYMNDGTDDILNVHALHYSVPLLNTTLEKLKNNTNYSLVQSYDYYDYHLDGQFDGKFVGKNSKFISDSHTTYYFENRVDDVFYIDDKSMPVAITVYNDFNGHATGWSFDSDFEEYLKSKDSIDDVNGVFLVFLDTLVGEGYGEHLYNVLNNNKLSETPVKSEFNDTLNESYNGFYLAEVNNLNPKMQQLGEHMIPKFQIMTTDLYIEFHKGLKLLAKSKQDMSGHNFAFSNLSFGNDRVQTFNEENNDYSYNHYLSISGNFSSTEDSMIATDSLTMIFEADNKKLNYFGLLVHPNYLNHDRDEIKAIYGDVFEVVFSDTFVNDVDGDLSKLIDSYFNLECINENGNYMEKYKVEVIDNGDAYGLTFTIIEAD